MRRRPVSGTQARRELFRDIRCTAVFHSVCPLPSRKIRMPMGGFESLPSKSTSKHFLPTRIISGAQHSKQHTMRDVSRKVGGLQPPGRQRCFVQVHALHASEAADGSPARQRRRGGNALIICSSSPKPHVSLTKPILFRVPRVFLGSSGFLGVWGF